jgi:hypothetical protein
MNATTLLSSLAILFATVAIAADQGSVTGTVNGAQVSAEKAAAKNPDIPKQSTCLSQCASNEQRCSREVRLARKECQRVAASAGRDVFTGRGGYGEVLDYSYFCEYFAHPAVSCSAGSQSDKCQRRLAYRHGVCLSEMKNIASMRYDCYRAEKDANVECRADLSACKSTCE